MTENEEEETFAKEFVNELFHTMLINFKNNARGYLIDTFQALNFYNNTILGFQV